MIVHAHIFKPHASLWKGVKNDKAECHIINCDNSQNCGLFHRGECAWRRALGWSRCPYGKYSQEKGFTKRARAYSDWIYKREKKYEDVGTLSGHTDMMAEIGDYVFLPYAHMDMNENVPFEAKGGAFRQGSAFFPKEHFTIENIIKICDFRPQALFGGEIKTYQQKEVPKFLVHLSEQMPSLFKKLCAAYPRAQEIIDDINYIDRKAVLATLVPNVGSFKDIHGREWTWGGTYLTSVNSHASFLIIGRNEYSELHIKPTADAVVKITCNAQVNKDTKLLS